MGKQSIRLLTASAFAFVGLAIYVYLYLFVAPRLLNSRKTTQTYAGFYIQNLSFIGKISNLHCGTNGLSVDSYAEHCRFNVSPSNIKQFTRMNQLLPKDCVEVDLSANGVSDSTAWWRPLDFETGAECYSKEDADLFNLLYSPSNQLAFIRKSD